MEIMIATLVLAVLVIGGAAVLSKAGGGIQQQQNKREALIAADAVMEHFWNRSYYNLKDNFEDSTIATNVSVNGKSMSVAVTVSSESTDVDGNPYLELSVSVRSVSGAPSDVYVTRRYEFGLSRAALED